MKVKSIFIFCLFTTFSHAQYLSALTQFAIERSARNSSSTSCQVTKKEKNSAKNTTSVQFQNNSFYFLLQTGLLPSEKVRISAKDSMLKKYSPLMKSGLDEQTIWRDYSTFDTTTNRLYVLNPNPYYGGSTCYTFDSLGRITELNSETISEVPGGGGSSSSRFEYYPEIKLIKVYTSYNSEKQRDMGIENLPIQVSEIRWNLQTGLPTKAKDYLSGSKDYSTTQYFYFRNVLIKSKFSQTRNQKTAYKQKCFYKYKQ